MHWLKSAVTKDNIGLEDVWRMGWVQNVFLSGSFFFVEQLRAGTVTNHCHHHHEEQLTQRLLNGEELAFANLSVGNSNAYKRSRNLSAHAECALAAAIAHRRATINIRSYKIRTPKVELRRHGVAMWRLADRE